MATETLSPNIAKIYLTERAALKIRALLEKDGVSPEQGGLRGGVQGASNGCNWHPLLIEEGDIAVESRRQPAQRLLLLCGR